MSRAAGRCAPPPERPRIGISECLLGREVRYDGGHKRDRYAMDVLGEYFEWVPVCPEVEVGMGTPREPLRLLREADGVRMVTIRSGDDWTGRMHEYSRSRLDALATERLRGWILKKDSPSCGMERVKVYDDNDVPSRDGRGLFAAALLERFPNLPVEEEGRLDDRALRENFICRVYTYDRWRRLVEAGGGAGAVVEFHARHKYLLLAHEPAAYRVLGRLVAAAGRTHLPELLSRYEAGLMEALSRPAPVRRHVDALHHILGFLKQELSSEDRAEILDVIEEYRAGTVPLITPLTLLRFHLRKLDSGWIHEQVYLQPYPRELALRSHV